MSNESESPAKPAARSRRDRSHLTVMRYRFPPGAKDGEGTKLVDFEIREVDTFDMQDAAKLADANDSSLGMEQLAVSIVRVNGQPLVTGSVEGWNEIAFDFALMAYRKLNSFPVNLAEELLAKGEVVPA